ncbi:MAG TPA: AAA family ATPase [Opitutaceae bacterium]|nr:AAA family ATPase [Opitutaceae bacterium]
MKFALSDFGVDLTALARGDALDPVFGREHEIDRVIRILARKTKNNPVLLGEPGVGKTAIVEGLAHRIAAGTVPGHLADIALFSLNLGSLLAGTGYRGDFEERLQQVILELRQKAPRRLLFVDELHLIARAGRSEGGLDAGNLLKPLLARGELPCIGASTPAEWRELVAADPALERRFQPVDVPEPTPQQTLEILRGLRGRYESHHGIEIGDDALAAAVDQSVGAMPGRRFPDKAVDLLDEACARLRLTHRADPTAELVAAQRELAVAQHRFDFDGFARLKHHVLPRLQAARRPRLDAAGIGAVCGTGQGSNFL